MLGMYFFAILKIPTDNEWHDEVESNCDDASRTDTNDGMVDSFDFNNSQVFLYKRGYMIITHLHHL